MAREILDGEKREAWEKLEEKVGEEQNKGTYVAFGTGESKLLIASRFLGM